MCTDRKSRYRKRHKIYLSIYEKISYIYLERRQPEREGEDSQRGERLNMNIDVYLKKGRFFVWRGER